MLMPSTPSVYPQVVSRCFASFRVGIFGVSAGHAVSLRGVRFPAAAPQRAAEMRPFRSPEERGLAVVQRELGAVLCASTFPFVIEVTLSAA